MFHPPADGWSTLERLLLRTVIINIYRSIEDPLDKFILMASTESAYKQEEIASMCGISQVAINKRLKKTQKTVKSSYSEVTIITQ